MGEAPPMGGVLCGGGPLRTRASASRGGDVTLPSRHMRCAQGRMGLRHKEIIMVTQAPSAGTRIVVGVDGSGQSKLALSWAVRIAATTGATIDAVTAWHFPMNSGWGYTPDAWDPEADATQCLTDSIEDAFGTERPTGLRLLVREGLPAKVLLDDSTGATML